MSSVHRANYPAQTLLGYPQSHIYFEREAEGYKLLPNGQEKKEERITKYSTQQYSNFSSTIPVIY